MSKQETPKILWSQTLPDQWGHTRAKYLFQRMKRTASDSAGVVTAFRDGEVTLRTNRRTDGFTFATKEIGYQGVCTGDLVIHSMDAFAGAIGVSDSNGKCSPVYLCCTPIGTPKPHFYAYTLRHMASSGYINSLSKGIRERSTSFGWSEFSEQTLPVPPLKTQTAITKYLDRKTAAIDTLIAKKERLLELLAEKRAALINQAVTKGLDPNVPMKDSGVEWIGEIPTHWKTIKQKYLTTLTTSGSRGWSDHFTTNNQDPIFFLSGNIGQDLEIDLQNTQRVAPPQNMEAQRSKLKPNDTVICITGAKTGNVAHIDNLPHESYINQHVALIRPDTSKTEGRFLAYSLKSLPSNKQLEMTQYGGTKQGLSLEDVRNVTVTTPPKEEQKEITNHLNRSISNLKNSSTLITDQIQKLREYRQALITAAVTGQVEVPDE